MKLLFTGGGTLGSVTPLLALREAYAAEEVYWIGTRGGVEEELVSRAGIHFFPIFAGKLRRYLDWRTLFAPFALLIGLLQAFSLLRRLRPTIVFAAGGYVAVPVMWAAWLLRIPSYTIQLDRSPGLANRLVAPFVRTIFCAFEESAQYFSKQKAVVTGAPVRKKVLSSEFRVPSADLPTLLVLGGGTGALSLNKIVVVALPEFTKLCCVVHITGRGKFPISSDPIASPRQGRDNFQFPISHYHRFAFLADELFHHYRTADLVLTRAGMGTLSELAALRKPAIVVPLPDTHQEDNAELLARHNAAVVVAQNDLTPEKLISLVTDLLQDAQRRKQLGENLHTYIPTDGAEKIVQYVVRDKRHR